ncbi:MAG: DUF3084 domain-containing protein [Cyanobacteriota bacterium]|nr:DUF3084 domain-containing protein [Cyanobacteriota bacterium]
MSGWLLILALLILGGVLSTLGDRLGSRVGKARLSLFNLRPRRTAVLITVLTGSMISALSLGLMLLVSTQLRVGLFELDELQDRLKDSRRALKAAEDERRQAQAASQKIESELIDSRKRAATLRQELEPLQQQRSALEKERARLSQDIKARDADIQRTERELQSVRSRIKAGEQELVALEKDLLALRRGSVAVRSGQVLARATVRLEQPSQAKQVVDRLLQEANLKAYGSVRPGEPPDRQILLVPRSDVKRLQSTIRQSGTWVVSLRSATNVLRGESIVYAFPEVRPNRTIVRPDDVLATTTIEGEERSPDAIRNRLNLLLASSFAEVQRRGSLSEGLQFDGSALTQLGRALVERTSDDSVGLQVVSVRSSDTADPVLVKIEIQP